MPGNPQTLFISDLHLCESRPEKLALFEQFMARLTGGIDALYILGDLFEFWHGDDDLTDTHLGIINVLARLTGGGTAVYFQRGNRDFLVGDRFAEATGSHLLPDHHLIDLYGRRALLMHGDLLCTDDTDYQRMRRLFNRGWLQWLYLRMPLAFRRALSSRMRRFSNRENAGKSEEIMDVSPASVIDVLQQYGVDLLIHGHTHRPAMHTIKIDGGEAQRIVLGDWYSQESVLVCRPDKLRMLSIQDYIKDN